jgi:predicted transcriptional regulator
MGLDERDLDAYECSTCGTIALRDGMTCCDEPMDAVDATTSIDPPETESLVREVFGMSATDLELCRVLMAEGEATVRDLTGQLDRDRTSITRRLNHLADVGVLEKRTRVLPGGGRANVYSPRDVEYVRRRLELGLYAWLDDALDLVAELNREKIEAMAEAADAESSATPAGADARGDDAGDAARSMVDLLLRRGRSQ